MLRRGLTAPAVARLVGRVNEQVLAAPAPVKLVLLGVVDLPDREPELGDLRLGRDLTLRAIVDADHYGRPGEPEACSGHSTAPVIAVAPSTDDDVALDPSTPNAVAVPPSMWPVGIALSNIETPRKLVPAASVPVFS